MIPAEVLAGLFGLAFTAMITPGPNNLIVLALGIQARPDRIAMAGGGILSGTVGLLIVNWFGMATIFTVYPVLRIVIVGIGSLYLGWCGLTMVLGAFAASSPDKRTFPASFWALAGFQFTNPKAWVLCVSAVSAMQLSNAGPAGLILLTAIFGIACVLSLSVWACAGRLLPLHRDRQHSPPWMSALPGFALIVTSAALAVSAI